ncbi:hypothetical protein B0H13DRAFT_1055026 [Mycena leptocephala]|nr:hypothetical protein B0H13DRAFT_1055026 [Mycena leptocephala]
MSSSHSKDRFAVIGIHVAPAHLSKKEFERDIEALADKWLVLPVIKENALKMEIMFSNDTLDAHARAIGMPEPRHTAIIMTEYETPENMLAVMQHAESKKLVAAAEEFRAERGACVFTAEVSTDIDKAGPKDRVHGIAILKGLSPEQYEQKMAAILDGMYALPAVDTYMLKSTVCRKNKSMASHLHALGLPAPEGTLVVHFEYESQDHLMKLLDDAGVQKIHTGAIQDSILSDGSYFCTDVITKFERK